MSRTQFSHPTSGKTLRITLALAFTVGLGACAPLLMAGAQASAPSPDKVLQLVTFNDVYEIQPVDKGSLGGAARVATLVNQLRAQNPNTLVLFAGDLLSPSVMSGVFKGEQMVAAMNSIGVDYATLGNHELDFGLPTLKTRVAESKFKWLSANILDTATGAPVAGTQRDTVITVGAVKVGIFGLAYDFTPILADKTAVKFQDAVQTAQAEVKSLRAQGAQYVIALTHEDAIDDCTLSKSVSGLDFIVGGHDHSAMSNTQCGTAPYVKATSDARNVWSIKVNLNGKTPEYTYTNTPVTAAVPEYPATAAVVASYASKLDADFNRVIGQTTVPLDATEGAVREKESNLGNFIADALRTASKADIAVMNGGSIRTDTTYPAGDITKKDIFSILPFGNTLVVVKVKGSVVRAALENGVSQIESTAGRFLQVSGMTYAFNPKAAVGSRIVDVTVGGKALDDNATYSVAINDYLYSGGDGYTLFQNLPTTVEPSEGPLLAQIVSDALSSAGHIAPALDGRIILR
jgi:2',3'-cyclic-nucleotide 2'-phosphodiesterase (5'-nucleotidase family)